VYAQAPATFKGQSNLVLVPTVVHDKSGTHIANLKKEDFRLFADGKERKIAVFEEVRPGNQKVQRPKTAPNEFTNILGAQVQSEPNRITVIALDTILTQELRQATARKHLLQLLADNVQGDSMVALVLLTSSGPRVIHDLTSDPNILITALKTVAGSQQLGHIQPTITDSQDVWRFGGKGGTSGGGPGTDKDAQQQLSLYYQGEFERRNAELERKMAISIEMDGLEQIAYALRGLPGRKSLIWVGGGFPYTVSATSLGVGLPGVTAPGTLHDNTVVAPPDPSAQIRSMLPTYERVWKAMNEANVAIYSIDVRGLTTEGDSAAVWHPSPDQHQREHWMDIETRDTFRVFAEVTGGDYYTNTNDFDRAYRESMNDSAAYYLLGYYVDRKQDKAGWHELSVKVARTGASVRSRNGFVLRNADDKQLGEQELEVALRSPMDYTGLALAGRWTEITGKTGKRKVSFSLLLPPGMNLIDETAQNHLDLEFYVRVQDKDGKTVAHSTQEMEGRLTDATVAQAKREGIRYENSFELVPGDYGVHFVVRDKLSGRMGSVVTTLTVAGVANEEAK
jgi:VWFA-related protein